MPANSTNILSDILSSSEEQVLNAWVRHQLTARTRRADLIKETHAVKVAPNNAEGFKQGAETLQVSVLSDAARHSA